MNLSTMLYYGRKRTEKRQRVYQQKVARNKEDEKRDEIEEYKYEMRNRPIGYAFP